MKHVKLAVALSAIAFLSACTHSPIPLAENFQLTTQKKVRSAGHWEILSKDVITQTSQRLTAANVNKGAPLFVVLPKSPTPFDQAFNDFLVTELVNEGYNVSSQPSGGAVLVSYKTQLVKHNSDRPNFVPGAATALTAGLYVAHGLGVHASTGEAMAGVLGFAALADLGAGRMTIPTSHELILTTTVESNKKYLVRSSDVYYIENLDASLFTPRTQPIPSTQLKVVSQ